MDAFNVLLNIKGAHVKGSVETAAEFITEGLLTRDEQTWALEFDELGLSGLPDTVTRFKVEDGDLWLIRTGLVESAFRFQEQQIYETAFRTPMGLMQVSILPTQVASRLDLHEGDIELEYVVKVGGDSALNRLNIHYQLRN